MKATRKNMVAMTAKINRLVTNVKNIFCLEMNMFKVAVMTVDVFMGLSCCVDFSSSRSNSRPGSLGILHILIPHLSAFKFFKCLL